MELKATGSIPPGQLRDLSQNDLFRNFGEQLARRINPQNFPNSMNIQQAHTHDFLNQLIKGLRQVRDLQRYIPEISKSRFQELRKEYESRSPQYCANFKIDHDDYELIVDTINRKDDPIHSFTIKNSRGQVLVNSLDFSDSETVKPIKKAICERLTSNTRSFPQLLATCA